MRVLVVERDAELASLLAFVLDLHEQTLTIGAAAPVRLTPHEFGALRLLISTPGRTVTIRKRSVRRPSLPRALS